MYLLRWGLDSLTGGSPFYLAWHALGWEEGQWSAYVSAPSNVSAQWQDQAMPLVSRWVKHSIVP